MNGWQFATFLEGVALVALWGWVFAIAAYLDEIRREMSECKR